MMNAAALPLDPHAISPSGLLASVIDLNHPGHYVHWGFIQLSVANLVVILLMVFVFAAAVLAPFPHRRAPQDDKAGRP